jgi:hypothetical protein
MTNVNGKQELALRLRKDAEATSDPHYAILMRRAADEIDASLSPGIFDLDQRDRLAG